MAYSKCNNKSLFFSLLCNYNYLVFIFIFFSRHDNGYPQVKFLYIYTIFKTFWLRNLDVYIISIGNLYGYSLSDYYLLFNKKKKQCVCVCVISIYIKTRIYSIRFKKKKFYMHIYIIEIYFLG